MTQPTEYQQAFDNNPDGGQIGKAAADKIGFYGITPIIQRAYTASLHLSSTLSSSTTFSTAHLAAVNEIQATFVALGIWATA